MYLSLYIYIYIARERDTNDIIVYDSKVKHIILSYYIMLYYPLHPGGTVKPAEIQNLSTQIGRTTQRWSCSQFASQDVRSSGSNPWKVLALPIKQ